MPILSKFCASIASLSLVPTPSVADSNKGSLYPSLLISNTLEKLPKLSMTASLKVLKISFLRSFKIISNLSISTPDCLYVIDLFLFFFFS